MWNELFLLAQGAYLKEHYSMLNPGLINPERSAACQGLQLQLPVSWSRIQVAELRENEYNSQSIAAHVRCPQRRVHAAAWCECRGRACHPSCHQHRASGSALKTLKVIGASWKWNFLPQVGLEPMSWDSNPAKILFGTWTCVASVGNMLCTGLYYN